MAAYTEEKVKILAGKNENKTEEDTKSSGASIGVNIGASGGGIGINAGYSKGEGKIKENGTTYTGSQINAKDKLQIETGKDLDIIGSKISGNKAEANIGGSLNIESLQAKQTYHEKNSSQGFNISTNLTGGKLSKPTIGGGTNKGKIESGYQSVTDQAGIYAGQEGFDITVGKNTDLKGAVIASGAEASKNKISTETLTYEDIENKAEYEASSNGTSVNISQQDKGQNDGTTKTETVTKPDINTGIAVKGEGESTTKSAIAQGTIEVRSEKDKDLEGLSRDTENALNKLEQIFDKEDIKEQQELVNLFSQEASKAIGDIALQQYKKALNKALKYEKGTKEYENAMKEAEKWGENGKYKAIMHGIIGGITSKLAGGSFEAGSVSAGIHEVLQKQLGNIKDGNLHQIVSRLIGMGIGKIMGEDGKITGGITANSTKHNWLEHYEQEKMAKLLAEAIGDKEQTKKIVAYYTAKSMYNIAHELMPSLKNDEGIEAGLLPYLGNLTQNTDGGLNYTLNHITIDIYGNYDQAYDFRSWLEKTGGQYDPFAGYSFYYVPSDVGKDESMKPIFDGGIKLGVGVDLKVELMGVGGEIGLKKYYEEMSTECPKETLEGGVNLHLTNQIKLGIEYKGSVDPTNKNFLGNEYLIGLKVGKYTLGITNMFSDLDIKVGGNLGVFTPVFGIEGNVDLNLTELYRRYMQERKEERINESDRK